VPVDLDRPPLPEVVTEQTASPRDVTLPPKLDTPHANRTPRQLPACGDDSVRRRSGRLGHRTTSFVPLADDLERLPKRLPALRSSRRRSAVVGRNDAEVLQCVDVVVDGDLPDALVAPLLVNASTHPHAGLVLHLYVRSHGRPLVDRLDPVVRMLCPAQ
jgi:hypothetical protein